jgi:Transglycosylase SLT domain/Peptidase_C39 like family
VAGSGIWLDDATYLQTAGQIWAQQQQQTLQAGHDWAQQQIADTLSKLQAMVPQVPTGPAPTPTPTPAPVTPPPQAPPSLPTPAPPPPLPIGGTPVATPTPDAMTGAGITPAAAPTPTPPAAVVPPPPPASSLAEAGQNWAQQQIQNLLNPSQPSSTTPTTPTPDLTPPSPGPTALPSQVQAQAGAVSSGPQPNAPGDLVDQTRQAATGAGIDPDLFARQINQESGFNPNAGSPAGAQGIAQFMPETARGLGIDPTDPGQALPAAANLMKSYLAKYGGDWSKALAAYNAGPGNVDKYGGVPPFDETQTYVKNILGGAKDVVQQGLSAVNTAVQGVQSGVAARASQFGLGLSSGDAMAFCGPTAAIAFAQTYGRNPTVDEAKQLAQQVGWNPDQGMAGPQSEVSLLKTMGVDAHATSGVDWAQVGRDASGGNPVIIDTPGHYYYVDGYNQQTGQLHVGTSGTDLKGGSEWMTPDQINSMPQSHGAARAAIFADHPLAQQDGLAQSVGRGQNNQPAAPDLGQAAGQVLGATPLPLLGMSANDITSLFGQNAQQLQTGRDIVGSLLAPDQNAPAPLRAKADSILQAVQDVGSKATQAGQDLLQQGQAALQQAPQTVSDMLSSNALLSRGIPTVQGALGNVPDLSAQGIAGAGGNVFADLQAYAAQHPEQFTDVFGNSMLNPPTPENPAQQVIGGAGQVVQGVQTGNLGLGGVLGGALNVAGGVLGSQEGGGGGAGNLARLATSEQAGGLLANLLRSRVGPTAAPESAVVLENAAPGAEQVLRDINASAQRLQQLTDQVNSSIGTPGRLGPPAAEAAATVLRQPGLASGQFARLLGGAAAGGLGGYELTDPNDPNRGLKIAAAAGGGALAAGPGLDLALQAAGRAGAAQGAAPGPIPIADWLRGAYRGGVIGGLNTMADVAFNSTLTPALSGVAGVVRDLASFQPGRLQGRVLGAQSGIVHWTDNFLQGLSDSLTRPTSLTARAAPGVQGVMANLIEGAGALHGAFQNATSELIRSMEVGAAAGESASASGASGPAWFTHFQGQLLSPPGPVAARAQAMGERTAARGDLGQLASAFGRLVTGMGPVGDALFPVYRMGMAMASRMVESTPLGLAGTAFDVARGLTGRGPYADLATTGLRGALDVQPAGSAVGPIGERLANNLIGTALSMWLANKAVGGAITGNGPSDPGERQVWIANGNQPNSFLAPDGAYHSWEKLPPALRGPMMTAGAYADAVQAYNVATARQQATGPEAYGVQDPRVAAAAQLVSEVGQQIASATPMRTFANLYDALQSNSVTGVGLTAAGDVASSIAGGAVPMSGLVRSVAQMTDPTQRQALTPRTPQELPQSVLENVTQNIPGLRENLPARQDVLGRPLNNPLQGLGELLPVRTAAGQPTPLLQAMQTAGVASSPTPQTIPYGPTHEVRLTPQEQRTYEQYRGQVLQQAADTLVRSPQWQQMPAYAQRAALENINSAASTAAGRMVLRDIVAGPGAGQSRMQATGVLAPVVGYGPDVTNNQLLLQQQLMLQQQHQALMQSLLGGQSNQTGLQALMAANARA